MGETGQSKRRQPPRDDLLRDRIVDTAIQLAEEIGWDNLRLRKVAERMGITLQQVHDHFRDADGIADAWFARAQRAMIQPPEEPGFDGLAPSRRAHTVMMRWFEFNAPHRRVVAEMIRTKLYPSHPHHWVPMVFSLSRLIHWVREAALLDAGGRQRQTEEIGLTWVFLKTLRVWARDGTPEQEYTREYLSRRLDFLDRLDERSGAVPRRRAEPGPASGNGSGPGPGPEPEAQPTSGA